MKRILAFLLIVSALFPLAGCGAPAPSNASSPPAQAGDAPESASAQTEAPDAQDVDVDLTQLSSTMIYSEVFAMLYEPDKYVGKTVKMKGQSSFIEYMGDRLYTCIIQDAAACCAQGLEYMLAEGYAYPESDAYITVIGTFDTYEREYDGKTYVYAVLRDARML